MKLVERVLDPITRRMVFRLDAVGFESGRGTTDVIFTVRQLKGLSTVLLWISRKLPCWYCNGIFEVSVSKNGKCGSFRLCFVMPGVGFV